MKEKLIIGSLIVASLLSMFLVPFGRGGEEYVTYHRVHVTSLDAEVKSPSFVEPDEYFEVTILIWTGVLPIDLWIGLVSVEIDGAGISWSETIANNLTINSYWAVNKTALVKAEPNTEGSRIDLTLSFDFQDFFRKNKHIYLAADMKIAHVKQKQALNVYQLLTYIFIGTTIAFMGTTVFFWHQKTTDSSKPHALDQTNCESACPILSLTPRIIRLFVRFLRTHMKLRFIVEVAP